MRYEYCGYWVVGRGQANEPLTEEEARTRFASDNDDDWFSVAAFADGVPDDGIPEYVLEVLPHAEYIKVFFYDQSRSLRYIYGFRKHGDAMFQVSLREYTYPDATRQYGQDECAIVESIQFKPEGIVHQDIDDVSQPTVQSASYRNVDVAPNWEPIPEFGQWESIARFDRDAQAP